MFRKANIRWPLIQVLLALWTLSSVAWGEETPSVEAAAKPRKILIYTLGGHTTGHLGIAASIQDRIRAADPNVEFEVVDITVHQSLWQRRVETPLFWTLTQKTPNLMDRLTANAFRKWENLSNMAHVKNEVPTAKVAEDMERVKPDVVLFTHFGLAHKFSALRALGEYRDVPMGYVQSEALEEFFPRIVSGMDRTFLADPTQLDEFVQRGAPKDKMVPSGVPLDPVVFSESAPEDRADHLTRIGFDPGVKTIVVAAGGGGMADLPDVAKKIAAEAGTQPIQLIVMAGMNERNHRRLEALKNKLPANVKLHAYGYVDKATYWSALKASDLYVGKAGGIAATALSHLGKPAVYVDFNGGFERTLNRRFQRTGRAVVNNNPRELGRQVMGLLNDEKATEAMVKSHEAFQKNAEPDLKSLVDFSLNGQSNWTDLGVGGGVQDGKTPTGMSQALRSLEQDFKPKVEILYSYQLGEGTEGFRDGQMVLRVGNNVIVPGVGNVSLKDFLYSTRARGEFGADYGVAYWQTTLGLRLKKVPPELVHLVEQLKVGEVPRSWERFQSAVTHYLKHAGVEGSLVSYDRIVTPEEIESLKQQAPAVDARQALHIKYFQTRDPFQKHVDKRVRLEPGVTALSYDNMAPVLEPPARSVPSSVSRPESGYLSAHRALLSKDYAPARVHEMVQKFVGDLTSEERQAFWEGNYSHFDRTKRRAAQKLDRHVKAASAHWEKTDEAYDAYQQERIPFLMDQTLKRLESEVQRLGNRVSAAEKSRWVARLAAMRTLRQDYESRRSLYGEPKDYLRVQSASRFMAGAESLAARIGKNFEGGAPLPGPKVHDWKAAFTILKNGVGTLALATLRPSSPALLSRIRETTLPLADALGLSVEFQGELPPPSTNPKEITLVVAHHGTGSMELAGINAAPSDWAEGTTVFAAPDLTAPRVVGNVMEKNPGFIVVGRGSGKPMARMKELIEAGHRNFIVMPDGYTGTGNLDVLPVRPKWATGMVGALKDAGYGVRIANVAMPTNVTLRNDITLPESKGAMQVIAAPPWDAEMVDYLTRVGGVEALAHGVRAHWLASMEGLAGPEGTTSEVEGALVERMGNFCDGAFAGIGGTK